MTEPKWSREWPTEPGWYWALGFRMEGLTTVEVEDCSGLTFWLWGSFYDPEDLEKDHPGVIWLRIEPPDLDAARKALEVDQ